MPRSPKAKARKDSLDSDASEPVRFRFGLDSDASEPNSNSKQAGLRSSLKGKQQRSSVDHRQRSSVEVRIQEIPSASSTETEIPSANHQQSRATEGHYTGRGSVDTRTRASKDSVSAPSRPSKPKDSVKPKAQAKQYGRAKSQQLGRAKSKPLKDKNTWKTSKSDPSLSNLAEPGIEGVPTEQYPDAQIPMHRRRAYEEWRGNASESDIALWQMACWTTLSCGSLRENLYSLWDNYSNIIISPDRQSYSSGYHLASLWGSISAGKVIRSWDSPEKANIFVILGYLDMATTMDPHIGADHFMSAWDSLPSRGTAFRSLQLGGFVNADDALASRVCEEETTAMADATLIVRRIFGAWCGCLKAQTQAAMNANDGLELNDPQLLHDEDEQAEIQKQRGAWFALQKVAMATDVSECMQGMKQVEICPRAELQALRYATWQSEMQLDASKLLEEKPKLKWPPESPMQDSGGHLVKRPDQRKTADEFLRLNPEQRAIYFGEKYISPQLMDFLMGTEVKREPPSEPPSTNPSDSAKSPTVKDKKDPKLKKFKGLARVVGKGGSALERNKRIAMENKNSKASKKSPNEQCVVS